VENPEMPAKAKIAAFNALRMADKDQYERDQLEEAGKSGSTVTINVVTVDSAPGKDDAGEQAAQLPDGTPRPRLTTINVETAV
jgi:hypothetical protein